MNRSDEASPLSRFINRWQKWIEPTSMGLPNWRVIVWFPLLVFAGAIVLTILNISGTSSGMHWYVLGEGVDPRLILGTPRAIRSDEWLIYQSLAVSQVEHGFPAFTQGLLGGVDASVFNQLPVWDWFVGFRPQTWVYLVAGLEAGVAWAWWLPGVALVSGCYLLMVALLPRRPITSASIAAVVYVSPIMQWWRTEPPVAWVFIAIAGVIFTLVDSRLWVRITWAAIVGYVSVVMAMGLYLPFIIPGIYVVVFFAVGFLLERAPWRAGGAWHTVRVLLPLMIAAVASVAILVVWAASHWEALQAVQSTVYPGRRTQPTGALLSVDPYLTSIAGAPWSQALRAGVTSMLGGNASEASSVFLLVIFVLPVSIWLGIRSVRNKRPDWPLVFCCGLVVLFLAYFFVPGWDSLAQLMQLDKVGAGRLRIVFLLLMPIFVALTIRHLERNPSRRNWIGGAVSAAITFIAIAAVAIRLEAHAPETFQAAPTWVVVGILLVAAVVLLYLPRYSALAAILLLAATLVSTGLVNPFYRGVVDLRETATGTLIDEVDDGDGVWVGVGSYEVMALLMQTGVQSMSGFQTYPPDELWDDIDPDGSDEAAWNRLAHVRWEFGSGEPTLTNPSPDVVTVTFDPCSEFAQQNVNYVLGDTQFSGECLLLLHEIDQGSQEMRIWKVIGPAKPKP